MNKRQTLHRGDYRPKDRQTVLHEAKEEIILGVILEVKVLKGKMVRLLVTEDDSK